MNPTSFDSIYADLFEYGLDAALLTRPSGTILCANPAACAMFGYTVEEFQSLGRTAIIDPGDPAVVAAVAQRSETGHFRGVLTVHRKDGRQFPALISSAVFTSVSGETRTAMFIQDLTTLQTRETELRIANEELRRALAEVKTLHGMLPICSYCKRVRDDAQYWSRVEEYISARTDVQFTHGICPACYKREFADEDAADKT